MYTPQTTFAGQNPFAAVELFKKAQQEEFKKVERVAKSDRASVLRELSPMSGPLIRYLRTVENAPFSYLKEILPHKTPIDVMNCLKRLHKSGAIDCAGPNGRRVYWVTNLSKTPPDLSKSKEWRINVCAGFIPKY